MQYLQVWRVYISEVFTLKGILIMKKTFKTLLALAVCGLMTSCDYENPFMYQLDGSWKLVSKTVTTTFDGVEHEEVVDLDYDYILTLRNGYWKAVSIETFGYNNKRTEKYEGNFDAESEEVLIFYSGGVEIESRLVHIDNLDKKNMTLSYDEFEPDFGLRHFVAKFKRK